MGEIDKLRDPEVQALLDKQAITETLMRYCRGVDRLDFDTLRSVYWPEARDEHAIFEGNVDQFIEFVKNFMGSCEQSSHQITNVLIEFDNPSEARVESYVWTFQDMLAEGGGREDLIATGRYLDRFVKRGPEWRILHRILTIDTVVIQPTTANWGPNGLYAGLKTRGVHYPRDPLYTSLLSGPFTVPT
jgi:hypothetical protein